MAHKPIPWCTVFLVLITLTAHTVVLVGNLAMSKAFKSLGHSTAGWSGVGTNLSQSLTIDISQGMSAFSNELGNVSNTIMQVQNSLDAVLSMLGQVSDGAISQYHQLSSTVSVAVANASATATTTMTVPSLTVNFNLGPVVALQESELHEETVVLMQLAEIRSHVRNITSLMNLSDITAVAQSVEDTWKTLSPKVESHFFGPNRSVLPTPEQFKVKLKTLLREVVDELMDEVEKILTTLWALLEPSLSKVANWTAKNSGQIQTVVSGFMTSLDRVQKIFDKIMSQLRAHGPGAALKAAMESETFELFDINGTGQVTVQNLQTVASLYGVNCFQGSKAAQLVQQYDTDGDGSIEEDEFLSLINDPSVSGSMDVVIRAFANKLSELGGQLGLSTTKGEAVSGVVSWLGVHAAHNVTKLGWVVQALINGTLPSDFTSCVMRELVLQENVTGVSTGNLGLTVVGEIFQQNASTLTALVSRLSDPSFYAKEGFDAEQMPQIVSILTAWVQQAIAANGLVGAMPGQESNSSVGNSSVGNGTFFIEEVVWNGQMPAILVKMASARLNIHRSRERARQAKMQRQLYNTRASKTLRLMMLGDTPASGMKHHRALHHALRHSTPADETVLEFANWLAANATGQAKNYLSMAFNFSGTSSSAMDSFANAVEGVTQKVTSFLSTMAPYASPDHITVIDGLITNFSINMGSEILTILDNYTESLFLPVYDQVYNETSTLGKANISGISKEMEHEFKNLFGGLQTSAVSRRMGQSPSSIEAGLAQLNLTNVLIGRVGAAESAVSQLTTTLTSLQTAIPSVLSAVQNARTEVNSVVAYMNTTFAVFQVKGKPLFFEISELYTLLWTAYFVLFGGLTIVMLFYGFWAEGWFHGPKVNEDYTPPVTFADRLRTIRRACGACCGGCRDSAATFWSIVILLQLIVLVEYVVSILIAVIGGVKAFIVGSCAEIYILGDPTVCAGTLQSMGSWLESFYPGVDLDFLCDSQQLLTCALIGKELHGTVLITIICAAVAAVMSYQLILDSAINHERAYWTKYKEQFDPAPVS